MAAGGKGGSKPAGAAAAGKGGGGAPSSKAAAAPSNLQLRDGTPTRTQRLVVAIYVYFIPVLFFVNVAFLFSRWTAVPWLLYVIYINFGPGKKAAKDGSWPKLLRRAALWRHFAGYFPARLHKTADLPPDDRYVFVAHPHGITALFCWPVFDTNATGFMERYPGIDVHPMTLELNFKLPLMREFLLAVGVVDASQEACFRVLGRGGGAAIMLAVGGAQESLHCQPGTLDLVLKKRKGFARIALQTGAKLVPVIGFGENELYDITPIVPGSLRDKATRFLKYTFGFVMPNANGVSLLFGRVGWMPHPRPLDVVVGAPVVFDIARVLGAGQPDQEMPMEKLVDAYHEQYCEAVTKLYNDHKEKYHKHRVTEMRFVE